MIIKEKLGDLQAFDGRVLQMFNLRDQRLHATYVAGRGTTGKYIQIILLKSSLSFFFFFFFCLLWVSNFVLGVVLWNALNKNFIPFF